jgi:hypothetical protein
VTRLARAGARPVWAIQNVLFGSVENLHDDVQERGVVR